MRCPFIKEGTKFCFSVDTVVANRMDPKVISKIVLVKEIPLGWLGLDGAHLAWSRW